MILNTGRYVTSFGLSDTITSRYTYERKIWMGIGQFPLHIGPYSIDKLVYGRYLTITSYLCNLKLFLVRNI